LAGWYFRYHSIHIQITYTYRLGKIKEKMFKLSIYNLLFFILNYFILDSVCTYTDLGPGTMGDCIVYTQYPATNVDECLSLCEDANEESSGACQAVSYFSSLHICSLEECTRHRPDPHDITTHFYVRECPDAGKTNAIDVFIFFDSTYGNSRLIINSIVSIFVFYILHIKLLLSVYVYTYYILHIELLLSVYVYAYSVYVKHFYCVSMCILTRYM
jgi:hypothetical protein